MRIVRSSLALAALVFLAACGSGSPGVVAPAERGVRDTDTWTDPGSATPSSDTSSTRLGPGLMGSGN